MTRKDVQWMQFCVQNAKIFATCAKRQYFSVIVDDYGHIVGTGYNGGPSGTVHCVDGGCPRLAEGSASGSSYDNCIAIHAEANALLHTDYSARRHGCTLYVNGPPCFTCAKLIVNSGVTRLVCLRDSSYADWPRIGQFLAAHVEVVILDG